jgi:hypothetical protein
MGNTRSAWSIFFVNDITPVDLLYLQYQRISEKFQGWTLSEIKAMPYYERKHWTDIVLHEAR